MQKRVRGEASWDCLLLYCYDLIWISKEPCNYKSTCDLLGCGEGGAIEHISSNNLLALFIAFKYEHGVWISICTCVLGLFNLFSLTSPRAILLTQLHFGNDRLSLFKFPVEYLALLPLAKIISTMNGDPANPSAHA